MLKTKISAFNVNSVRARLELLDAWFAHRDHDVNILCMQELKTEASHFPYDFFFAEGFTCHLNAQKRYNGVSVCTKIPPEEIFTHFPSDILNVEKRLIYARYSSFHLINVYAPHGDLRGTEKFEFKLAWYDAFIDWLKQNFNFKTDKIILTGDFNITYDALDVYDAGLLADTVGTMPEEREKLHKLIALGFVDAWRYKNPGKPQFTWWDYKGGKIWKNQGMRIDFMLLTEPVLPHLVDIEVDMWARRKNKIKPSDHAPLVATFKNLF